MLNLLGKWYALDSARYYNILCHKEIHYYKLYITRVEADRCYYDSFIQFEDGTIQALKVDKETTITAVQDEINAGYLIKTKSSLRPSLNSIGNKYGLNITVGVSND